MASRVDGYTLRSSGSAQSSLPRGTNRLVEGATDTEVSQVECHSIEVPEPDDLVPSPQTLVNYVRTCPPVNSMPSSPGRSQSYPPHVCLHLGYPCDLRSSHPPPNVRGMPCHLVCAIWEADPSPSLMTWPNHLRRMRWQILETGSTPNCLWSFLLPTTCGRQKPPANSILRRCHPSSFLSSPSVRAQRPASIACRNTHDKRPKQQYPGVHAVRQPLYLREGRLCPPYPASDVLGPAARPRSLAFLHPCCSPTGTPSPPASAACLDSHSGCPSQIPVVQHQPWPLPALPSCHAKPRHPHTEYPELEPVRAP